jgi:hypothetical protein
MARAVSAEALEAARWPQRVRKAAPRQTGRPLAGPCRGRGALQARRPAQEPVSGYQKALQRPLVQAQAETAAGQARSRSPGPQAARAMLWARCGRPEAPQTARQIAPRGTGGSRDTPRHRQVASASLLESGRRNGAPARLDDLRGPSREAHGRVAAARASLKLLQRLQDESDEEPFAGPLHDALAAQGRRAGHQGDR